MKHVSNVAYWLKLPEHLKIHPTFHVSFLKQFHEDGEGSSRTQAKQAPPTIRVEFDKEIEKILDHRTLEASKKNWRTEYLVQWKGSGIADATWEKAVSLW